MNRFLIAALWEVVGDTKEALDWFIDYHNSTNWADLQGHWKPEYLKNLEAFRLKGQTVLYRALSWPNYEDYLEYEHGFPLDKGANFKIDPFDATYESWTKSLKYAKSFVALDPFGFVIQATIQPSDSILDFDNLPSEVTHRLKHGEDEQEVLVKSKTRDVKMVYIYDEYGDLKS